MGVVRTLSVRNGGCGTYLVSEWNGVFFILRVYSDVENRIVASTLPSGYVTPIRSSVCVRCTDPRYEKEEASRWIGGRRKGKDAVGKVPVIRFGCNLQVLVRSFVV